jgi:NADP-dependent 3-hydroxy acid dehydrogenase YdfG
MSKRVALIVGAGPGISAAFGESLVADGYQVALAARDMGKLRPLAAWRVELGDGIAQP